MADWFAQNAPPQSGWFAQNAPPSTPGVPNPLQANPQRYTPAGLRTPPPAPWGVPSSGPHKTFAETVGPNTPLGQAANFAAGVSNYLPSPESVMGATAPAGVGAPGLVRRALNVGKSIGSGVGTEWALRKGLRATGLPGPAVDFLASAAGIGVGARLGRGAAGERPVVTTDLGTTSPAAKIPSIPPIQAGPVSSGTMEVPPTIPTFSRGTIGGIPAPVAAAPVPIAPPNTPPEGVPQAWWNRLTPDLKQQLLDKIAAGKTEPLKPAGLTAPKTPPPAVQPTVRVPPSGLPAPEPTGTDINVNYHPAHLESLPQSYIDLAREHAKGHGASESAIQRADIQTSEELHKQGFDAEKWKNASFPEQLAAYQKAQQARVDAGHIATPRTTLKQDAQGLNKIDRISTLLVPGKPEPTMPAFPSPTAPQ